MAIQNATPLSAEAISERLRSIIPGIVVETAVDGAEVWVSAVFESPSYERAYSRIHVALNKGVEYDPSPRIHLAWAASLREWGLTVLWRELVSALGLKSVNGTDLSKWVTFRTRRAFGEEVLNVHISTGVCFDHLRTSREQMNLVENDLLQRAIALRPRLKLPKGISRIHFEVGDPEVDMAPRTLPAYDDGDDDNPNWPSRTGNPSGGGRGNNLPRR